LEKYRTVCDKFGDYPLIVGGKLVQSVKLLELEILGSEYQVIFWT